MNRVDLIRIVYHGHYNVKHIDIQEDPCTVTLVIHVIDESVERETLEDVGKILERIKPAGFQYVVYSADASVRINV